MKLLYAATSLSFAQSLRIALDQEEIEYYCSDADASVAGIAGPMGGSPARFYVLHEQDWDRAVDILRALAQPQQAEPRQAGKPLPVWLVMLSSMLLMMALVFVLTH
ncbi:putative signal transducing protein [Luteimonas aquatica]|uniref:putative signal transducing protein n=1 Tax=Luteimonas aquatica TaxID=450364 RepID=UPI001F59FB8F|nr:DUF2007 domain-containing protein [Luteimonas aquatica]